MRLAVSLCNHRPGAEAGLVEIDLETGATRGIPPPAGSFSATGLAVNAGILYSAFHGGGSHVALYDPKTLDCVATFRLPTTGDIHSIGLRGGTLYAVSTTNDTIVKLKLGATGARFEGVLWTPTIGVEDSQHVNAFSLADGRMLCSAFGPKEGERFDSAFDGYVYDLEAKATVPGFEGLYHPHSAMSHGGEIYCLESQTGSLVSSAGRFPWRVNGYARGLCFLDDETVAIGSSIGREGPLNTFGSTGDPGTPVGWCGITIANLRTGPQRYISLQQYNREIYDIVALPK